MVNWVLILESSTTSTTSMSILCRTGSTRCTTSLIDTVFGLDVCFCCKAMYYQDLYHALVDFHMPQAISLDVSMDAVSEVVCEWVAFAGSWMTSYFDNHHCLRHFPSLSRFQEGVNAVAVFSKDLWDRAVSDFIGNGIERSADGEVTHHHPEDSVLTNKFVQVTDAEWRAVANYPEPKLADDCQFIAQKMRKLCKIDCDRDQRDDGESIDTTTPMHGAWGKLAAKFEQPDGGVFTCLSKFDEVCRVTPSCHGFHYVTSCCLASSDVLQTWVSSASARNKNWVSPMELADVVKQIQETESEVDRMWTSAREQGVHEPFLRSCFSHAVLPDSNPVRELLIELREKTTKVPVCLPHTCIQALLPGVHFADNEA